MRFLDLRLLRFGHFSDCLLDFSAHGASLHLIHGANEAGKSTTLRAVSGLLFGIPETTRDHHVHDMKELRIGAQLENQRGERIRIIRRKGRKNTLLNPAGEALDDAALDGFLGGLGREQFETLFGLSHDRLVRGGQTLLEGRGDLGESLFGAGIGVRSIHAVRNELHKSCHDIFAPRAQQRPLNLALKAFREARSESARLALKPREWKELTEQLANAEERLGEFERDHSGALAELNRLQRIQRVTPLLQRRREIYRQLEALGEVRAVSPESAEERRRAQQKLAHVELQQNKLCDEQARCEREQARLHIPEALLAHEALIENLRDRLGAYKQALSDHPGLKAQAAAAYSEARRILRDLDQSEDIAAAERLRIGTAAREQISKLGQDGIRLEVAADKAQADAVASTAKLEALQQKADNSPPVTDTSALRRLLAEIRKRGDLEEQARTMALETTALERRIDRQIAALPLWSGTREDIDRQALPVLETIDRFRRELEQIDGEGRDLENQLESVRKQIANAVDKIGALQKRGAVPTEADLALARTERDALWRIVRAVLTESATDISAADLAAEFEVLQQQADDAADRLWQDAERAAQYATLCEQRDRLQEEEAAIDRRLGDAAKRHTAWTEQWRALWRDAGLDPLPPVEMKSWLAAYEKLVETDEQRRTRQSAREALLSEIAAYQQRCRQALIELNQAPGNTDETLNGLLQYADEVIAELEAQTDARRQLRRELERCAEEQRNKQHAQEQTRQALAQWRERWVKAIQPLGLDADAGVQEAEVILKNLMLLFQTIKEGDGFQERVKQIEDYAADFRQQVAELARECDPALVDAPIEQAAAELVARLGKGKSDRQERINLDKRLKQIRKELDELAREREAAQATLDRLMAAAGVTTLADLEAAEQRAASQRDLHKRLTDLEEQLSGEGVAVEVLEEQSKALDPDTLPADIQHTESRCADLGKARESAREELWALKNRLAAMDGSDAAAAAAATAEEALAEIKTHVASYVRLKLSALLLDREIERYRERNQGPIVQRAGELFRRMTLESFVDLATGFDDNDNAVLLCVREDGRRIPVEGLSEGSRDQLYLALRLASLERHLEHGEPPPLVLDDILINFDDRRSRATLAVLGELAAKTQVLFFTHHQRLVELAREALPAAVLQEHELEFG